jgi:hypothetical protein
MNNAHIHPEFREALRAVETMPYSTIAAAIEHSRFLEAENSKLRARLAFTEKMYHEIIPYTPFAWIDHENVDTTQDVFHTAVVRFLDLYSEKFEEMLARMHKSYARSENTEAKIAAKGEF